MRRAAAPTPRRPPSSAAAGSGARRCGLMTRAGATRARRAAARSVRRRARSAPSAARPCCRSSASWSSAIVTLNLLNGQVPFGIGGSNGNGGNGDGPARTAAPSNVVVVPEEAAFEGSIVYAKGGNIWVQTDEDATQLTVQRRRLDAVLVADGQWIYFIRTPRTRSASGRSAAGTAATTSRSRT